MLLRVPGTTSLTLGAFTSLDGTPFAITNMVAGQAHYTANSYQLIGMLTTGTAADTITAIFTGTPPSAPSLEIMEFGVAFGTGSLYVDEVTGPFQSYNVTSGTSVIAFLPSYQYGVGELFCFCFESNVSNMSNPTPSDYTGINTSSSPLLDVAYALDAGNALGAVTLNAGTAFFMYGLGCVFKYVQDHEPLQVVSALGVI
jgi:hypothetical protein